MGNITLTYEDYARINDMVSELQKDKKKLEKKYHKKQMEFDALVEHLKFKYEYTDKRIFHIIENYNEKYR